MKLTDYKKKRDPARTNEPFGEEPERATPTLRGAYVVHQHDATRMHYDLRLEVGGVLASFAVPRGPSLDPEQKHLAVRTEDHPIEYLDFEEVIPEGQYGGGPMIVWDRGGVRYLEGPAEEELQKGKVDFQLDGYKLHGRFALVKLKKSEKGNEWLLFKKRDAWAAAGTEIVREQPRSVLSAMTVEELLDVAAVAGRIAEQAQRAGAPLLEGGLDALAPVPLREEGSLPKGRDWRFELALDGVRVLGTKAGDEVALRDESGHDVATFYPEVARALKSLAPREVALEGSLVAFDEQGKPSLTRMKKRAATIARGDAHTALLDAAIVFVVSDLAAVGERDVRGLPLASRKELVAALLPSAGVLRAADSFDEGAPLVAFAHQHGVAGVVARPAGARAEARLVRVDPSRKPEAPVVHERAVTAVGGRHRSAITNPDKIFWPDEGYTKKDLIQYYDAIAPALLPYLRDRPVALVRYPDGIQGKNFYQWNVMPAMPAWVRSIPLGDESTLQDGVSKGAPGESKKRVFLVNDRESLIFIANLACIPIHVLACRSTSLDECDFFTLDFDVKGASLAEGIVLAETLHELLDAAGFEGFPKTSGQSGLHVLVPLGPGQSFDTARALADLLGGLLVRGHPKIATMERIVQKRGPRVYVDTGQTGRVRTIVAPYSVRAVPGATVSAPLRWDEVTTSLDPKRFTIRTMAERLAKAGDPMKGLLSARPDVARAVARLEKLALG